MVFESLKLENSNKVSTTLIDKKSLKTYLINLETEKTSNGFIYLGGIPNNLDGGAKFRPIQYFIENGNEYLLGEINAFRLKMHTVSNEFINSTPKYPEKKKELEKLAESLKETDNPVLIMVRLKN